MKQKILMLDDHPYATLAVATVLAGLYEFEEVRTLSQARVAAKRQKFDLVILDLILENDDDVLELVPKLHEGGSKVLVLTSERSQQRFADCLAANVNAFVLKNDIPTKLPATVQAVLQGDTITPPTLVARALTHPQDRIPRMGKREEQVMACLFTNPGMTNEEIANKLHISLGRTNNIFTQIFTKLNVHKRQALLEELRRRGYRPKVLH